MKVILCYLYFVKYNYYLVITIEIFINTDLYQKRIEVSTMTTRATNLKVESIVLYSPRESGFTGKLCVIPSNRYTPGDANAPPQARLLPFSADIGVAGDERPTGRIVVSDYRLFPRKPDTATPALDRYLGSLLGGAYSGQDPINALREDPITFQHARVLATVVAKVNRQYVQARKQSYLYAPGWEETNAGPLQILVAEKFGDDIAQRIESELFFTFRRSIRLTENEFDPRYVDPEQTHFGGGRRARASEDPTLDLTHYDGYREGDKPRDR